MKQKTRDSDWLREKETERQIKYQRGVGVWGGWGREGLGDKTKNQIKRKVCIYKYLTKGLAKITPILLSTAGSR